MSFLYHLCPPDMRGTILYPLNELCGRLPDVYEPERAKFVGREGVLDYRLPLIDVAWADTVNLSALDPRLLIAERHRLGVPTSALLQRRLVRIPVERLRTARAVRYIATAHWTNSRPGGGAPSRPPIGDFTPFDVDRHQEVAAVPSAHTAYLAEQLAAGEPALAFVFVPHVLVAGPVDLDGLPLESLT